MFPKTPKRHLTVVKKKTCGNVTSKDPQLNQQWTQQMTLKVKSKCPRTLKWHSRKGIAGLKETWQNFSEWNGHGQAHCETEWFHGSQWSWPPSSSAADVQVLTPVPTNVTFHGNRNFADVMKAKTLRAGEYPDYPGASNLITVLKRIFPGVS